MLGFGGPPVGPRQGSLPTRARRARSTPKDLGAHDRMFGVTQAPTLQVRSSRPVRRTGTTAVLLLVLMGIGSSCTTTSAYGKLIAQMKGMCAQAHAPTDAVSAIPAGAAVGYLQVAGMSTAPWDHLPPADFIAECGSGQVGSGSIFLDRCGRRSSAPPPPTTVPCPTDSSCAPLVYEPKPPFTLPSC
jgi:hypothetical protein